MNRIVSADEARKLRAEATQGTWIAEYSNAHGFEVRTPDTHPNSARRRGSVIGSGGYARGTIPVVINTHPDCEPRSAPGADAALIAAAPDLAYTVARLHDILAAERGERAPEGWVWDAACQVWRNSTRAYYVRRGEVGTWCWYGEGHEWGRADTALEAIEAAERAAKDPT